MITEISMLTGRILWFIILRDGIEIFRDPSKKAFTDNNAIQPYQTYIYTLSVCNSIGCVNSKQVMFSHFLFSKFMLLSVL